MPFTSKNKKSNEEDSFNVTTTKQDDNNGESEQYSSTQTPSQPLIGESSDKESKQTVVAVTQEIDSENQQPTDNSSTESTTKIEASTAQKDLASAANAEITSNRQDIIMRGIAEITNSLIEDYNLNDLLTMVLETIYRGMGFTRVLFCIPDPKNNMVLGRFGLGKNVDEIIPKFRCKIEGENIFTHVVKKHREFIILDVNSEEYKHQVPEWLRKLTMPCTVVLYPIVLNKRCIGLLYADTDDAATQISPETLNFFKTLRNQATLAIKQKR